MADVTLHDGQELSLDLYKISRREFEKFRTDQMTPDEENALLGRISGLTAEKIADLPQPDFDQMVKALFVKRQELMRNPT